MCKQGMHYPSAHPRAKNIDNSPEAMRLGNAYRTLSDGTEDSGTAKAFPALTEGVLSQSAWIEFWGLQGPAASEIPAPSRPLSSIAREVGLLSAPAEPKYTGTVAEKFAWRLLLVDRDGMDTALPSGTRGLAGA